MARNYSNGAAVTERGQFHANNDAEVARRTSATAERNKGRDFCRSAVFAAELLILKFMYTHTPVIVGHAISRSIFQY